MTAVAFAVSSCNKKTGCTDSTATNYCKDCKKDYGSCHYERIVQHVFWFDRATADSLFVHSYNAVSCVNILNGQEPYNGMPLFTYVIVSPSYNYPDSAPDCSANNMLTVSASLKKGESKTVTYTIADLRNVPDNFESAPPIRNWTGTVTLTYDACGSTQLVW